jgi:fucose 4-O-acetylase-like acetyltransferase
VRRNYAIDYFKFFLIYFVICLHTFLIIGGEIEGKLPNLLINLFPRFVIPFFFVSSGYFFEKKLNSCNSPVEYFKNYVIKLIKLFTFWFIFYFIYDCLIRVVLSIYMGVKIKKVLLEYFHSALSFNVLYYGSGVTSFHLWFLSALIWSIVILFIFIKIKKLNILLVLSLILNIIGLFGQTYSGVVHLHIQTTDAVFFGLFYTTLGYYVAQNYDLFKYKVNLVRTKVLISLSLFFCGVQIIEKLITVNLWNGTEGGVDYYLSTIPLTICLFLIVIKHSQFGRSSIISKIGRNSVGIYVTHMLFISLIDLTINYFELNFLEKSSVFYLLTTIGVFFISHIFSLATHITINKLNLFYRIKIIRKTMIKRNKYNNSI